MSNDNKSTLSNDHSCKMQQLHSNDTATYKFSTPAIALLGLSYVTLSPLFPIYLALFFAALFVFWIWFSLPLKKVRFDGEVFYVNNFFDEITIPSADLVTIVSGGWYRPKYVTLIFAPQTKWGTQIRIVPPREKFESVILLLQSLLEQNIKSRTANIATGNMPQSFGKLE